MRNWLLPYGVWYVLAAWGAVGTAVAVVTGDVPAATLNGALAVIVGMAVTRSRVRWSRSGEKALRAELIRLIDERAGSGEVAWLHRDAHLLFTADRTRIAGLHGRTLMLMDEDLLRDVDDARDTGGGKVAATFTVYRAHPALARVVRRTGGTTALVTAADIEQADPDEHERWWQRYQDMTRAMRAGLAFADAGDLAEVIAQFRDAEPVSPDAP